jgi:GH25 family lysozyme M1 (1,4-beta-N-acetylmuramidase)
MKNGIDVSVYQGDIDWKNVKNSGIEFAIIKAGGSDSGFYTDSKFEQNYANAKAVGMPVGAYYFVGSGCISKADGIADAKRFLEIIKGKTFEYPVYIDLEATSPSNRNGATEACIGFCETMENAGYYCGIYASDVSGFNDRLDLSRLSKFDKWVARYGSKPVVVKSYGIWQKSDSGRISGINGNVDEDTAYKDYPTIIKNAGLNGFKKPENPAPPQNKPAPQKVVALTIDGKTYEGTLTEK